ncbi:hypothetical protein [Mesorhizobium sp.]|uniref:hypothetical protein n=1 Tax=Mesorhizobium sp. TaxID=1871066 RepID=UPI00257EE7F6|nr:hypothetical protein [Mesorhizobium sp.]
MKHPSEFVRIPGVVSLADVGAAPHLPAGILSPYSDGERAALINDFANHGRCKKDAAAAASLFSPHYTGRSAQQGDEGQRQLPQLVEDDED